VVTVWDSASTKVVMPPPPWTLAAYSVRGEIAGFSDERYRAAFQTDIGALSVLDLRESEAVFWMRDAAELTSTEAAAPFLRILHWWLEARGKQVIHAAAVGAGSGGVLIAGAGGAGKSSTALSCLDAGMRYAADDYCLLDGGTIHSLFNSAKVHTHDLDRLPFMRPMVGNPDRPDREKAVCYIHEHRPRQLVDSLALRAILLPRLTGKPGTTLERATAAEAMRALAPSTISQLPHAGPAALRAAADAARRVPAYHLHVGTEVRGIPGPISDLLRDSSNGTGPT